jgi:hypothetical protein
LGSTHLIGQLTFFSSFSKAIQIKNKLFQFYVPDRALRVELTLCRHTG